jgi:hypothetical protein
MLVDLPLSEDRELVRYILMRVSYSNHFKELYVTRYEQAPFRLNCPRISTEVTEQPFKFPSFEEWRVMKNSGSCQ